MPKSLDVSATLAGRRIFLTGATGFLGKLWCLQLLTHVEEVERITLLIRPKGSLSGIERFEEIVNSCLVFEPLHERWGNQLSQFIKKKVEVVEGDASKTNLGLDDATVARLAEQLDLVVHCAGSVDFNPALDVAVESNIDAALEILAFAKTCKRARFLHVSTCFVSGSREGTIGEDVNAHEAPNRSSFDPEAEYRFLQEAVAGSGSLELIKERFTSLGWPNLYTYSKSIAERLLILRCEHVPLAIVRPSICESTRTFPFPGWNEGFNTSAPLAYLTGTWLRFFPGRADVLFDVIPADAVCSALSVVAAALCQDLHHRVYQVATSRRSPLIVKRALELSVLEHRQHLMRHGKTFVERQVLSRWDTVLVRPDHILHTQNWLRASKAARATLRKLMKVSPARVGKTGATWLKKLRRFEHRTTRIGGLFESYGPFTYDHRASYECRNVDSHRVNQPPFQLDLDTIDWHEYWMNIHMKGLRRFVWPPVNGEELEQLTPSFPLTLTD